METNILVLAHHPGQLRVLSPTHTHARVGCELGWGGQDNFIPFFVYFNWVRYPFLLKPDQSLFYDIVIKDAYL